MDATNPYAPPEAQVDDVIDPLAPVELAERGIRLAAVIVDGIISLLVVLPLLIGVGVGAMVAMAEGGELQVGAAAGIGFLFSFVLGVVWTVVTILFVSRNGQTIGKKLLDIKVVRRDGSKASLGRIFWLRNVVAQLPTVVPYGIGTIYSIVDHCFIFASNRQCLHDKIADTVVVKA